MQNVTRTGFEVLNRAGDTLAFRECLIDACDYFRASETADVIVRCSDAAIMKYRRKRAKTEWHEEPAPAPSGVAA